LGSFSSTLNFIIFANNDIVAEHVSFIFSFISSEVMQPVNDSGYAKSIYLYKAYRVRLEPSFGSKIFSISSSVIKSLEILFKE